MTPGWLRRAGCQWDYWCNRRENNWKDLLSSPATPGMFFKQGEGPAFCSLRHSLLGKQLSCDRQNKSMKAF